MMRKLFTFLFAALMSVGMWALTPQGEDTWDDATKTLTVNSNPGYQAYMSQTEIEHVIISNSVTSIGYEAFAGCTGLTSMVVASGNTTYDSREDCNAIIETSSNKLIVGCQNTIIPNSVTSIGVGAFSYCTGLTSITIPNSVTSIGDGTAFYGCTGLTSITIPSSVEYIGDYTFFGCTGLTSVTIPNSVTSIGQMAFAMCTNITDVYCYPNAANLTWNVGEEVDFKADGSTVCHVHADQLSAYQSKFNGTVNVTFVGDLDAPAPQEPEIVNPVLIDGLYYNLDADNQTAEVTYHEYNTSTNYNYLTAVNIPESVEYNSVTYTVTSIGTRSFYNCSGLTSIEIPSSVTSIGERAFGYCSVLTSVECLGETPASLGNDVFYDSSNLNAIYVPCGTLDAYNSSWSSYSNVIKYFNSLLSTKNGRLNIKS